MIGERTGENTGVRVGSQGRVQAPQLGADESIFSLTLSGAGRFSFYLDYSERSSVGDHTFYVWRTQGSAGAVSVDYATSGDTHATATGTLSWADGEQGIKSFTANVASKNNGLHQIVAILSNPTGGAVLHNGTNTVAYGVIDDGTIPSDSIARFVNEQAGTNGTGTQASPYDNYVDAYNDANSNTAIRYIFGQGTTTIDGTQHTTPTSGPNGGGGQANCLLIPQNRTGEANRLWIMNWPGNTWSVTGGAATNVVGFYNENIAGAASYVTFRGIDFSSIDGASLSNCEGFGIGYFKDSTPPTQVNVEYCTGDDINGSSNTALVQGYYVDGLRMWRCTANNIQVNGSNTNINAGGLMLSYNHTNFSIQRCEATNAGNGIYHKGMGLANNVGPRVMFCYIHDMSVGLEWGFASSGGESNFCQITNNLFKNLTSFYGMYDRGASINADGQNLIAHNVFDNAGASGNSAIYTNSVYESIRYCNIFVNGDIAWRTNATQFQSDQARDQIKYSDYNHIHNLSTAAYRHLAVNYSTSALLNASYPAFAANDTDGDPLFTAPLSNDYTLGGGSPCLAAGPSGIDDGIYILGSEAVGA